VATQYDNLFLHDERLCPVATMGGRPLGTAPSLRGTGPSLPSAPGSARGHATARQTPEMLQMIQQDALLSTIPYDLTEWVEACTEQWKDLAGF